jgi:hypothetical protein
MMKSMMPILEITENERARIAAFRETVRKATEARRNVCSHCLCERTCGKGAWEILDCPDVKKAMGEAGP